MSKESAKSAESNGSAEGTLIKDIRKEFQQSLEEFYSKLRSLSVSTAKKGSVIKLRKNLIDVHIVEERVKRDEGKVADARYSLEKEIAYTDPIPSKYLLNPFRGFIDSRAKDLHYVLEPLLQANGFEFCPNSCPDFYLLLSSGTDSSVLDIIGDQIAKWKAVDYTPPEIRDAVRTLSTLGFKISICHLENEESLVYVIMACLPLVVLSDSSACLYTVFSVMQHKPSENQPKEEYTIPPATGT